MEDAGACDDLQAVGPGRGGRRERLSCIEEGDPILERKVGGVKWGGLDPFLLLVLPAPFEIMIGLSRHHEPGGSPIDEESQALLLFQEVCVGDRGQGMESGIIVPFVAGEIRLHMKWGETDAGADPLKEGGLIVTAVPEEEEVFDL
jgi:hypothetical protein